MLDQGGTDVTELFEDAGHSEVARSILDRLEVGSVKDQVRISELDNEYFSVTAMCALHPPAPLTDIDRELEVLPVARRRSAVYPAMRARQRVPPLLLLSLPSQPVPLSAWPQQCILSRDGS